MSKTPEEMAEEYANKHWTEEKERHAAYRGYVTGYCKAVEAMKTKVKK
jgi:hypothetical protein